MTRHLRISLAAIPFVIMILISFVAASCTGGESPSGTKDEQEVLTIYSGRSEKLIGPIIQQFSEVSGVKTEVKYGSTPEIAATILEEGVKSPADVFIAQDPGGLGAVEALLTILPPGITDPVAARFKSADGKWVGLPGARAQSFTTRTSSRRATSRTTFGTSRNQSGKAASDGPRRTPLFRRW